MLKPFTILRYLMGFLCGLTIVAQAAAQEENAAQTFIDNHSAYAGLYRSDDAFIIIGMIPDANIIYAEWMNTGTMRFLAADNGAGLFRYSPTRNATDETEGTIAFKRIRQGQAQRLIWTSAGNRIRAAARVNAATTEVSFMNGDEVSLTGTLIIPETAQPAPAVVLIPQSGRYDIWDVGMWMLSRGIAVLAYDQRNGGYGGSTGPEVTGGYQDQIAAYATDAAAAISYLRTRNDVDPARIGVAGWSGGGFAGAFVAGDDPDLAFYINIAGDASPGFEQASHMFVARMLRQGFSDEDANAARAFIAMHFGVADGNVEWDDYQREIARIADTPWYQFLSGRYSIPFTRKETVTEIGDYQAQWPPQRIYGKLKSIPTLGVFFEFDHSSAPSSPYHFQKALHEAGNGDYTVTVIPDTHHGGFILNGAGYRFDTSKLTGRSPLLIDAVADWAERHAFP